MTDEQFKNAFYHLVRSGGINELAKKLPMVFPASADWTDLEALKSLGVTNLNDPKDVGSPFFKVMSGDITALTKLVTSVNRFYSVRLTFADASKIMEALCGMATREIMASRFV